MKIKDKLKKYTKLELNDDAFYVITIMLLFIVLSIAMYVFGLIFQTPKICTVGDANGWLGFAGGLLGGIMTLIGVKKEINENKKSSTEELSIKYRPILTIEDYDKKINKNEDLFNIQIPVKNKYENKKKKIIKYVYFRIKNSGRGEANNTKVNVTCTESNSTYNKVFIDGDKEEIGFICQNKALDCLFAFTDAKKYKNNGETIVITVNIKFKDLNKLNNYVFECEFYFKYNEKTKEKILCEGYKITKNNSIDEIE